MGPRSAPRAASRIHTCSVGGRDQPCASLGLPMGPFLSQAHTHTHTRQNNPRAGRGSHRARLSVPSFLPQGKRNDLAFLPWGPFSKTGLEVMTVARNGWPEGSASSPALKLSVTWDWEVRWHASLGLPQSFRFICSHVGLEHLHVQQTGCTSGDHTLGTTGFGATTAPGIQ